MFLSLLTVIGVFISDVLLAILDPRIRLGGDYAMSSPSRSGSGGGDFGGERLEHWSRTSRSIPMSPRR